MDAQKANPDRGETSEMRRARYGIDLSLADIRRLHEELQNQEIQNQEIQNQEIQNQEIQNQEIQNQEIQWRRPAWQPFALGFAIGSVFFGAAIAGVWFLG
jgi:hypothetical protein